MVSTSDLHWSLRIGSFIQICSRNKNALSILHRGNWKKMDMTYSFNGCLDNSLLRSVVLQQDLHDVDSILANLALQWKFSNSRLRIDQLLTKIYLGYDCRKGSDSSRSTFTTFIETFSSPGLGTELVQPSGAWQLTDRHRQEPKPTGPSWWVLLGCVLQKMLTKGTSILTPFILLISFYLILITLIIMQSTSVWVKITLVNKPW